MLCLRLMLCPRLIILASRITSRPTRPMVDQTPIVTIEETYDASHAFRVIMASINDYEEAFARK